MQTKSDPTAIRSFIGLAVLIALGHYGIWLGLGGVLFVLSVLPVGGGADWLILALTDLRGWLGFPRSLWRAMWWGEQTPGYVNWGVTMLVSLTWGIAIAAWVRRRVRR